MQIVNLIKKYKSILLLLLFAFVFMTVCSQTSFLYPLHDRVDQNVFFTIGREMSRGKTVYKDLPEQKGPYVYFFNEICALICPAKMTGIYLFQIVSFFIYLLFLYKSSMIITEKNKAVSLFASIATGLITSVTGSFLRGDNVEEFAFMLMSISFYLILSGESKDKLNLFTEGVIVGLLFLVKFSVLGFWLGWFIIYFCDLLFRKKDIAEFFSRAGLFLLGFLITWIIPAIYLSSKGAWYDFYYQYIYINLFCYPVQAGIGTRFLKILLAIGKNFVFNPAMFILIHTGLYALVKRKLNVPQGFTKIIITGYIVSFIGTFGGGVWYDYYYLSSAAFTIFGSVYAAKLLISRNNKVLNFIKRPAVSIIITVIFTFLFGNCIRYYFVPEKKYPQKQFAEIINENNGKTLLNFGFIDQGFYLASGISPSNRFFSKYNISEEKFPEMYEDQWYQIENRTMDYVVIRMNNKSDSFDNYSKPELFNYYEIVATSESVGDSYIYALLKPKTN